MDSVSGSDVLTMNTTMTDAPTGSPATLNSSHTLAKFLADLTAAPSSARLIMSLGEMATEIDNISANNPAVIGVSAIKAKQKLGQTALTLAALWGRWERSTCLIDLGTGSASLAGMFSATSPDLGEACRNAAEGEPINSISRLSTNLPHTGVITAGSADVLGLISTGKLTTLLDTLKKNHQRIVIAIPPIETNFPFLSLGRSCDRLILSLLRGKTRGGPVQEIAELAMTLGMRPLEAIWYD